MDKRLALHELAARHDLDAGGTKRLAELGGLHGEPAALAQRLPRGLAVLAAALIGLGLVCWIAANWGELGRAGRFALLQGLVVVSMLGAWLRPAARTPLGLLALLAIGGLFAYFGQTYQTGADPWQLFALWALLGLPLALGARSDVLWAPWALVAMTAVSLWVQAHTGHRWRVQPHDLATHAIGWTAALVLTAALSSLLRRVTGAGPWALRTALVLTVVLVSGTALGGLFSRTVGAHYPLALVVLAGLFAVAARRRFFDVFALSAVALGLNVLLVAGLARWLFEGVRGDAIGAFLMLGLAAAGLLAATVSGVLKLARRHAPAAAAESSGAAAAAPERDGLAAALQAAVAEGLLPPDARLPEDDSRPWPVVLLTALGAWLAALPLLAVVGLLLGDVLTEGAGPYVVGMLLLAGAVTVLRARGVPLFGEQLAMPALLVGGGSLGVGLYRDLPGAGAAAVLATLALGVALASRAPWLRTVLGAVAAGFFVLACVPEHLWFGGPDHSLALALHAGLAVWAAALFAQQRLLQGGARAPLAAAVESLAAGWLPAVLCGLAVWSGMGFLVGAHGGTTARIAQELGSLLLGGRSALPWLSMALAAAGALWLGRTWPGLRRAIWAAAGGVLVALAGVMPALGAVLFALALCAASARWRLALACAVAAVWIVGAFYYQLHWTLSSKALVLIAAGALLGALAWLASDRAPRVSAAEAAPVGGLRPVGLVLGLVAVLAVANAGIWQKERLIAHGAPVFVELAPVDPRSLMQGDYMRLAYRLPDAVRSGLPSPLGAERPRLVAERDARGVARLLRLDDGRPLAASELRIELTPKDGGWTLVSDAWFFAEGQAQRFEAARYAEFRVADDGRALLVGLRDEALGAL